MNCVEGAETPRVRVQLTACDRHWIRNARSIHFSENSSDLRLEKKIFTIYWFFRTSFEFDYWLNAQKCSWDDLWTLNGFGSNPINIFIMFQLIKLFTTRALSSLVFYLNLGVSFELRCFSRLVHQEGLQHIWAREDFLLRKIQPDLLYFETNESNTTCFVALKANIVFKT